MKRLIYIVIIALAVGCGRPPQLSPQLADVDAVIEWDADSALRLLSAIDSASLRSDTDRAAYVLFRTMARDKSFLDIEADTAIFAAADYFRRASMPRYEMLAHCYGSRVRFERREYAKSVLLAMAARELAGHLDLPFYEALASRNIRDAYNVDFHFIDGLNYAYIAYDKFKESGRQPYINYALCDLASSLIAVRRHKDALIYATQSLDSATVSDDIDLRYESIRLLGKAYYFLRDYDKSINCFSELIDNGGSNRRDSLFLAGIYNNLGMHDMAASLLLNGTFSDPDRSLEYDERFRYYRAIGQLDSAYNLLVKYYYDDKNFLYDRMTIELPGVISEAALLERALETERTKTIKFRTYFVISLLLLLIGILTALTVYFLRRQRKKEEENLSLVLQLREILERMGIAEESHEKTVRSLLASKYSLLNQLSRIIYETPQTVKARRRMSDTIEKIISDFSDDSSAKYGELVTLVDELFDGVVSRFRDDFPSLRKADYGLFLYSILGFSASTISIFLKEDNVISVYERKRRLRNKIKNSNVPSRTLYLEFLNQKADN